MKGARLRIVAPTPQPERGYVTIAHARGAFSVASAHMRRLCTTFAADYTTPAKREEAKRLLAEIERELRAVREAL